MLSAGASQAALFASQKGGPMTACSMARFLKALYAEAGIAGASSHSGRRTLITRLAERGVDLKAIAEIAGHTSIRTTAMYVEAKTSAGLRWFPAPEDFDAFPDKALGVVEKSSKGGLQIFRTIIREFF